jgi:hypothetical protein
MWMPARLSGAAAAMRFAELYSTALGRLGDPRPPMRIGALRTLELLGQEHPRHRQAIVDVACAYLRMPTGEDGVVRISAQRILASHLNPSAPDNAFWPGMALDLTGATLTDLDLSYCRVDGGACFDFAVFLGAAKFRGSAFGGMTSFHGSIFHDHVWLERTVFTGPVRFDTAIFMGDAWFGEATFGARATFCAADFGGHAWFGGCRAHGPTAFAAATFRRSAGFRGAVFHTRVDLDGTSFHGPARISRRGEGWNLTARGWRAEVDPDNDAVGQLVWAGDTSIFAAGAAGEVNSTPN